MSEKTSAQADPDATKAVLPAGDDRLTLGFRLADGPLLEGESDQAAQPDVRTTQLIPVPAQVRAKSEQAPLRVRARQWAASHKWVLILSGILVVIAVLAVSLAATQGARGIQQAAVGGGAQMREASLAQADLSGQDLKWADLSGADLRRANLSGADLIGANLSGANLSEASLEDAGLRGADLTGALLTQAILKQADLHWAILRNADLSGADLQGADLQGADLDNVTLKGANLEGANLRNVHLVGTILPDGSDWTPSSNLRMFTDPTYPDFWRPGDAQSLALR